MPRAALARKNHEGSTKEMPTARHMASTVAEVTTCGNCAQPILTALDAGLLARVDGYPTDRAGELRALVAGLTTYTRTTGGHLIERDADRIGRPLDPDHTIHTEHRCQKGT